MGPNHPLMQLGVAVVGSDEFSDCPIRHLHHPRVVHRGVVTNHPPCEVVPNAHSQDDKENRMGRHEGRKS